MSVLDQCIRELRKAGCRVWPRLDDYWLEKGYSVQFPDKTKGWYNSNDFQLICMKAWLEVEG